MFLRSKDFSRSLIFSADIFSKAIQETIPFVNIVKRNAGHSEWANRKADRQAFQAKKSLAIKKIEEEINKELYKSKDTNLATNSKLKSIYADARKANIPQSIVDNFVKVAAAAVKGEAVNTFCYTHPLGIAIVVDISSVHATKAQSLISAVVRKYGFKMQNNPSETFYKTGLIRCNREETRENMIEKAFEDAITANCQEVGETDQGYLEFQCDPASVDICSRKLRDLGYNIEYSEKKIVFNELMVIEDKQIIENLDKMEKKLETLPGYMRILYNTK